MSHMVMVDNSMVYRDTHHDRCVGRDDQIIVDFDVIAEAFRDTKNNRVHT